MKARVSTIRGLEVVVAQILGLLPICGNSLAFLRVSFEVFRLWDSLVKFWLQVGEILPRDPWVVLLSNRFGLQSLGQPS